MSRPALASVLLALALASVATPARGGPKKDGFDFGPPPAPAPTAGPNAPAPGTTPAHAPPATDDPTAADIRELSWWPERRGKLAAESLLLRGKQVVPALLDVLAGQESASQPGAAWVLGQLGEPAHVTAILSAAARRTNGSRAEVFFDAAYQLDPVHTKDWLFSFLTLRRSVFHAKATEFLIQHVTKDDQGRVLKLLDSPIAAVREAGLRLLDGAKVSDVEDRLVQFLSDLDPDVARTACVLLAIRAKPPLVQRLNKIAVEGLPRERAYAVLALTEIARASGESPFEGTTLMELAGRRGLLHPEKLSRGAAAIGLAYGALDSPDPTLRSLLDRPVVDVLIDTVGGSHFRDFQSLAEPVFSALRRLSGLDLPPTAVAWALWWQTERDHFQARRPLETIAPKDLPLASVRFDAVGAEGGRSEVVFRSEDGTPAPGDILLGRDAFRALVDALEQAGIFKEQTVERPRADEHLQVTLSLLNQKRSLTLPAADPRYALMKMRMDSLLAANLWQRYRDTDQWPDAAVWWKKTRDMMASADPEARTEMLRAAIVHSWDDLATDADRSRALDELEDLVRERPAAGKLSGPDVKTLAAAAASTVAFGDLEKRAFEFAMEQPAADSVRSDLIEALSKRTEPAARDLLSRLLAQGGAKGLREAFADPRPPLRAAAARAARELLDSSGTLDPKEQADLAAALTPGLEVLSRDDDPATAIQAIVALQRTGAKGGVARLEAMLKSGSPAARIQVTEALGEMPAAEAYPVLSLLLAEEHAPGGEMLRATALRALARTGHEKAVSILTYYLLSDQDLSVRDAAGDALVEMGTDEARFAVLRALTEGRQEAEERARLVDVLGRFRGDAVEEALRRYLEDKDPRVSTAAALRLADMNVGQCVPYLIALVRGGDAGVAEKAVRALENVTCVRFDVEGHERIAQQYERWYQTARVTTAEQPDRAWFREALRKRGYDIGPLTPYVSGDTNPVAVPVLVRVLRDEDPVLRRGAAIALHRITGLSMGAVTRTTSRHDADKVADLWTRWWNRVNGGAGPR